MILFNFFLFALFAAIVAAVVAAFAIPFIGLFFAGLWKRSLWMTLPGGVLAGIILVAACFPFGWLVYSFAHPWSETTDPAEIRSAFKGNFNLEPGSDFVPLHYLFGSLADSGWEYLSFRVSPSTFEKMLTPNFQKISPAQFNLSTNKDAPDWWIKQQEVKEGECYEDLKWKGAGSTNYAYLFYDRSTGIVYFQVSNFD